MPEYPISVTGKWIDDKTGQVVDSAPVEGTQLVAPGMELNPEAVKAIEFAERHAPTPDAGTDVTDPVETTSEPDDAETAVEFAERHAPTPDAGTDVTDPVETTSEPDDAETAVDPKPRAKRADKE